MMDGLKPWRTTHREDGAAEIERLSEKLGVTIQRLCHDRQMHIVTPANADICKEFTKWRLLELNLRSEHSCSLI